MVTPVIINKASSWGKIWAGGGEALATVAAVVEMVAGSSNGHDGGMAASRVKNR